MKRKRTYKTSFVQYIPDKLKDGVLYVSIEYKTAAHICPCGCAEVVYTPISKENGWVLTYDGQNASLSPSIGNGAYPCRSHYYLKEGRIRWLSNMPMKSDVYQTEWFLRDKLCRRLKVTKGGLLQSLWQNVNTYLNKSSESSRRENDSSK